MRRELKQIDWDAITGILAAVLALLLHFLHIVEESVLLMTTLVLMALLFLRDLRQESETERLTESVAHTEQTVEEIRSELNPAELEFVGPGNLRARSQRFCESAPGDSFRGYPSLMRRSFETE